MRLDDYQQSQLDAGEIVQLGPHTLHYPNEGGSVSGFKVCRVCKDTVPTRDTWSVKVELQRNGGAGGHQDCRAGARLNMHFCRKCTDQIAGRDGDVWAVEIIPAPAVEQTNLW